MATVTTNAGVSAAEARSLLRNCDAVIERGRPANYYDLDADQRRRVRGKVLGILSPPDQRRLVAIVIHYAGADRESVRGRAAELLILTNQGFVERMIKIHRARGVELDVLRQECYAAIYDAIKRFDPELGASFLAYAEWRMRGAVAEAIRSDSRLIRLKSRASEIGDRLQRAAKLWEAAATMERIKLEFPRFLPEPQYEKESAAHYKGRLHEFERLEQEIEGMIRSGRPFTAATLALITGDRLGRVEEILPYVVDRPVRLDGPLVNYSLGRPERVLTDQWRTSRRTPLLPVEPSQDDARFSADISDRRVDVEAEALEAITGTELRAAIAELPLGLRRLAELYYNLDEQMGIQQADLLDGVYLDAESKIKYSAEQSVIADRRNRTTPGNPSEPAWTLVTARQRELNQRYEEGGLSFEPGTPEAAELFALWGVPPTSATIQENLIRVHEQLASRLSPLRELYRSRGDNALENSGLAVEAVREELCKQALLAGGTLVLGGESLNVAAISRLRPGKAAKDGIGRKGALRKLAELSGHVDPETGRLTFIPGGPDTPPAQVTPSPASWATPSELRALQGPRPLRVRPHDLVTAGLLEAGERLSLLYKGQSYHAEILADGGVRLKDGRVFSALSSAAEAAKGVQADPGWNSWSVERDGEQISLFELRGRYLALGIDASAETKLQAGVRPLLSALAQQQPARGTPQGPSATPAPALD